MFIKTDSENNIISYPYSLEQFRSENRNRSLPKFLNNRFLATQYVFPVYAEPEPEYNQILQNIRKDIENPYLDENGEWKYGWIITDKTTEQLEKEFNEYKKQFNEKINEKRDEAIYQPIEVHVSAEKMVPVDIRKDKPDIQNISGLTQNATLQLMTNDNTPVYFRGADDNVYPLSPTEVLTLGKTVAQHYSGIYAKAWAFKDQLANATSIAEVNQINLEF